MTEAVQTKPFKRRKNLKPDQRLGIWSHRVTQAVLSLANRGLSRSLAGLPKRIVTAAHIEKWFANASIGAGFESLSSELNRIDQCDRRQSTPEADCRILYTLTRATGAVRGLEIGTHLGYSTLHIAAGLRENARQGRLVTVDRRDVNDEAVAAYKGFGANMSALTRLSLMKLDGYVEFVVSKSGPFLDRADGAYDLVFIDGDHSEVGAYFDMVGSLRLLSEGGVIVLHDYYDPDDADAKFSEGQFGVFWAVKRLQKYVPAITVLPLKDMLPRPPAGSPPTSLAVLTRTA